MSIPERWLVVRAATPATGDEHDLRVEALIELGGRSVWEEDGWSVTHLPLAADDDPDARAEEVEARLREVVGDPGLLVQVSIQEHRDWEELWKVGLEPRRIADRIVVTPSWKTPEVRPGDLVITVDPKMAFGNAEHGTTRGCIRILADRVCEGDRLLDIGAGSAILSIAGALLGAASAHAVEGDPLAIETARENAVMNGVGERVTVEERFVTSDDVAAYGEHDGVIANIEAGLLRPLFPGLRAATRPGGWLLLSGILDHEWEDVRDDMVADGFDFETVDADREWRSILFSRPV